MKQKREITIYDIAKALNISSATVSRALQDNPSISTATRKKVNAMAEKLGYRHNMFASSLRSKKTHTIGVILHELNSYFITSVLAGIEKITSEANYNLIIAHSSEDAKFEIANANNLYQKRVDGVIASLAFDTANLDHYKQFKDRGVPVIFFDRVFENAEGTKVVINNFQAGYDATDHLIKQGCSRIAHITSSLQRNVYSERMRGYREALKNNKLHFSEKMLIVDGFHEEEAIRSAEKVLAMKPLPDGIFITNDFCAAVVMQHLRDNGIKVPQDIAIVGFNNDIIGKVIRPQLSTINYPGFEMGQVAARSLINHLKGLWDINLTNTIVIKSDLIVRQSSLKKSAK